MKYIFTFSFLLMSFLTFSQNEYTVITELLNVRSGAGTEYEVVGQIKLNQKVLEISKSGNWSEIKTDELKGCVSSKYISKLEDNAKRDAENEDGSIVGWLLGISLVIYILFKEKTGSSTKKKHQTPNLN